MNEVTQYLRERKYLFILLCIFAFLYAPIVNIFFEQDQWHNIGYHLDKVAQFGWIGRIFHLDPGFIPITQLINYLFYVTFGAQAWPFAAATFCLIGLNAVLWYEIVLRLTRNAFVSLFSVALGYMSPISEQAVTWVGPAMAGQLSFLGMNIALLGVLRWSRGSFQENRTAIFLTVLGTFLAVLTKLNGIILFLVLPAALIIFKWELLFTFWRTSLRARLIMSAFFVVVTLILVYLFVAFGWSAGGRSTRSPSQLLLNTIILPVKSVSQVLVGPPGRIYMVNQQYLQRQFGMSHSDPQYFYSVITEYTSLVLSLGLLSAMLMTGYCVKLPIRWLRAGAFSALFYGAHFLPYAFDRHSTGVGFLESRYYFLAVLPLGVILGLWGVSMHQRLRQWRYIHVLTTVFGLLTLSIYFGNNAGYMYSRTSVKAQYTQMRKSFLETIANEYAQREQHNIILYIQDVNAAPNTTGRYFQTGVLYPFLAQQTLEHDSFSFAYFEDDQLWSPEFSGVVSKDNSTVGLFYDYDSLAEYVAQNPEQLSSIIAYTVRYPTPHENRSLSGWVDDFRFVTYESITDSIRKDLYAAQ